MKRIKPIRQPKKAKKAARPVYVAYATIIDPVGAGFIGEGYVSLGNGNYRRSIHTSGS